MGNKRCVFFSKPASDLGSDPISNRYLLSICCMPGTISPHEVFTITQGAGPIYPVLQMRKVRFRESMLSPGFIELVSLCSQTSFSLPSPRSLPLIESECPMEHFSLSTNICQLGVVGKELTMGPSRYFTHPSLWCCFFNLILIALIFKSSSSGCFFPSGRKLYPFFTVKK